MVSQVSANGGVDATADDEGSATVQLLVSDPGNRRVITSMLDGEFDVDTSRSLTDADLYLIEDALLDTYRAALRERIDRCDPLFCPVVVIRRRTTNIDVVDGRSATADRPLLVDDFVDVPVDRQLLLRRLRSLLVRRRQSADLLRQVSTLEERERDLRQFERAVEDTGNAIAIIDTGGAIQYVNSAFETTTGYDESEALGGSLRLLEVEGTQFDDAFWRTMRDRSVWEGEIVAKRENGSQYVADTTITTITADDGTVEGFVAVLRDITERIQREQTLQDREQELDLLRQVLTRYLRHNLRNDLNVILGYAEFIRESASGEIAGHADMILSKTERLIDTSEVARRYSTLIEREGDPLRYNLASIVTAAVSEVRDQYPDVDYDVDLPETCPIVAGEGIQDVVTGLLENAAEHNDSANPRVRVRIRATERPCLIIEDNGPGIPEHDLTAFEAGRESPLTHSSGVGVWLSKWVIEGAGGQLSFDSTDEGTRVRVEFPSPDRATANRLDVPDLKAREQRLQTIIGRMTDAVIEVDESWRVTFLDAQAETVLDVDADAVVGRSFWDVFDGARDTRFETVYRDAMTSRSTGHVEEYYAGIDGWLAVYVYPDFDGGLSFYFRDITERKERERALRERVKELSALKRAADIFSTDGSPLPELLDEFVETLPVSFQNPADTEVRVAYGDTVVSTDGFDPEAATLSARAVTEAGESITLEVVRLGDRSQRDHGPFLTEERELVEALVTLLKGYIERQTYVAELARTSDLLSNAERLGSVGAWELDTRAETVYWTAGTRRIHGVDTDFDPDYETAFEFIHPDDRDALTEAVEGCLARGDGFESDYRLVRADGEERWVHVEGKPPADAEGVIRGYIQDVTDRHRRRTETESRQETLREIYEIMADRDREFEEQVGDLLELGRAELGTDYGSLSRIEGDDYVFEYVDAADDDIAPGDVVPLEATNCEIVATQEETLVLGDIGRDAPEETDRAGYAEWGISCYIGAPVFVDDDVYGTFCFYDTEPRAGQFSEWEVTLVDLMSRLVSYALQHEQTQAEIRRENERLDRFVAAVSHDLRNPLRVIEGSIELAQETGEAEHLARARRALDRTNTLIEDLLALARSNKTDPDAEPVGLGRAVEQAWENVPTDDATLEVVSTLSIRADPTMLRQLLENLLRNAAVYGGDGVTVTVGTLADGFYLEDDGPGIPVDDQTRVFEVGYTTGSEGTGFGLPIVTEVADAHGWDLRLVETEGGGARFEITGVGVVSE